MKLGGKRSKSVKGPPRKRKYEKKVKEGTMTIHDKDYIHVDDDCVSSEEEVLTLAARTTTGKRVRSALTFTYSTPPEFAHRSQHCREKLREQALIKHIEGEGDEMEE